MTAIPKPASTVVLIDEMYRVYLTKRPKTMKFLGEHYVFPGGSVDKEDYLIGSDYIVGRPHGEFDQVHYIAAARELFEEVGILLCMKDDGSTIQLTKEKELEYRRQLVQGEISFLHLLRQEGLYLNLNCLTYFGNRITPPKSPIRFDTRFFLAKLPEGQFPDPDLNEIDEAFWINPDAAIAAYQNGEMLMVTPTLLSLRTVMNYQKNGQLTILE